MKPNTNEVLASATEVAIALGISRSQLNEVRKIPGFPAPVIDARGRVFFYRWDVARAEHIHHYRTKDARLDRARAARTQRSHVAARARIKRLGVDGATEAASDLWKKRAAQFYQVCCCRVWGFGRSPDDFQRFMSWVIQLERAPWEDTIGPWLSRYRCPWRPAG